MTDNTKRPTAQWRSSPPFYQYLGFIPDFIDDGKAIVRMPFRDHLGNSRGEVHGGAIATIVDGAMSQAVRSSMDTGGAVATISLTLNYLAPARGEIVCTACVVRSGRSVAFAEAEATDETGKAVCRASGTYRLLPKR